jgi:hypothetical protein
MQSKVVAFIREYYQDFPATAYVKFARWISLRMKSYLEDLVTVGTTATLPHLDEFKIIIELRMNSSFPKLPDSCLQPVQPVRASTLACHVPAPALPPRPQQAQDNPNRVVNPSRIAAMKTRRSQPKGPPLLRQGATSSRPARRDLHRLSLHRPVLHWVWKEVFPYNLVPGRSTQH